MRSVRAALFSAAGSIAALTLLSRVIGFVRVWVQNWAVGTTATGEAYSTANTVPNVLFEVVAGGALAAAVIPLVSGFLARHLREDAARTVNALLTWVFVISVPMAIVVTLAAGPIMHALLPVAPHDEVALGATLLRVFAWQVPLYGFSVVLSGVLQAHQKFVLPALAPALSSLVVIGAFVAFHHLAQSNQEAPAALSPAAVALLGWGTTAGVVAFSLPQLAPVLRRYRLRPTLRFPAGVGRRALSLVGAGLGGVLAQQVQIVVVMLYANARGDVGTYPVYTFANQIYMVPYAVLAVPIATAVYPRLAEAAALPGQPGLARITASSTRLVLDIGLVCVALLMAVAVPVEIAFSAVRPVEGMAHGLLYMAPGLLGYALIYHCSRVLYATGRPRQVLLVNVSAWLAVVVCVAIAWAAGAAGRHEVLAAIGAAISIGMSVAAVGQLAAVRVTVGARALSGGWRSLLVMAPTAALAGLAGYWAGILALDTLGHGVLAGLLATLLAGIVTLGLGGGALLVTDRRAVVLARRTDKDDEPAVAVTQALGAYDEQMLENG